MQAAAERFCKDFGFAFEYLQVLKLFVSYL